MKAGRGGGARCRRDDKAAALKKGPWTAEEDDVLMEYVGKNGPKDWSSIRSKGLLPRSGKSCRLRWVNKLRPGLKSGCKFSAEEEQIVISLQAEFGNKWATIATYLPGRTDNDVKNFWSTRQKRLARLLHSAGHKKPQRQSRGKALVCAEAPILETASVGSFPCGEESSNGQCSKASEGCDVCDADICDLRDQSGCYSIPDVRQSLPPLDEMECDRKPCLLHSQVPQFYFPQLPKELLELPLLPEGHELFLGFDDVAFEDQFARHSTEGCGILHDEPLLFGLDRNGDDGSSRVKNGVDETLESFFSDFPMDMLDCDPLPPPSSSGF